MRLTEEEQSKRLAFLEAMESRNIDTGYMRACLEDKLRFEDFEYMCYVKALSDAGVTISHLPGDPVDASASHRNRMRNLYEARFSGEVPPPAALLSGCKDVRERIARLTAMTEGELLVVADDLGVEFVVRKYALAILDGDIKETHEILNQALGKPVERKLTENRNLNALADLSTDEIRAFLGKGGHDEIELEAEVE